MRGLESKVVDDFLFVTLANNNSSSQMEWLTGGRILAGYHEVVVIPETIEVSTSKFWGLQLLYF